MTDAATARPGHDFVRPTASTAASIGLVVFPGFLLGAFAPAIKDDLGFGDTGLGAMFTVGFFVSAIVLQFGGPFADLGPQRAVRLGLAIAFVGSGLVAVGAETYALLLVGFAIARAAEAIVQPATNSLIAGAIIPQRRGLAIGLKQSAVPVTTTLAGLAVPLLGATLGWRGVFGLVAVLAVPVALWVPFAPNPPARPKKSRAEMWKAPHLRVAAVAGGFSAGAVITVAGFLVTAAVDDAGFSDEAAGLLLTLGGIIMTVARVTLGAVADRRSFDRFRLVSMLLLVGAAAFPLFAMGTKPSMIVGTVVVFGIGWSFPGLLLLGIMEQHPEAPGAATAVVQTGVRIGAMGAPLLFGIVADNAGFATAWMLPMASIAIGSGLMFATSVAVRRRPDRAMPG